MREIGSLSKQIEEYEKKLQEKKDVKGKEIQLKMNVMRNNLETIRQSTCERACGIEKRKRDSLELCKNQMHNRKKFKKELEEKLDFKNMQFEMKSEKKLKTKKGRLIGPPYA